MAELNAIALQLQSLDDRGRRRLRIAGANSIAN